MTEAPQEKCPRGDDCDMTLAYMHGEQVASISIQSDGTSIRAVMSSPFNDAADGKDFADALRNLANQVEQKFHQLRFSVGHEQEPAKRQP